MNAIDFQNVGVRHSLLHRRIPTLKEWVIRGIRSKNVDHYFWALRNITLTVGAGEAIGIIGGNGAGKSTLLRVAAGIIAPAEGEAVVRGTLAPLIELGTGFDGELTGRENIFFNGALLGHSRAELLERMVEIVEFADIGEFIDAPLRTYSTGMVSRLAFAIATTIDPQILLLDEILSVGDAAFKQKCRERIREFWKRGTTVVLVSHDLKSVIDHCTRVFWLDHGQILQAGEPEAVIAAYREHFGVLPDEEPVVAT
jgi:ABC-type polysaccharide/polyol phosphate transport system ATPase subunit